MLASQAPRGCSQAAFLQFFWQKKGAAGAPLLQLPESLALLPFPALGKASERHLRHLAPHPCLPGSACPLARFCLPSRPGTGGAAGAASRKALGQGDLFPYHSYPLPILTHCPKGKAWSAEQPALFPAPRQEAAPASPLGAFFALARRMHWAQLRLPASELFL